MKIKITLFLIFILLFATLAVQPAKKVTLRINTWENPATTKALTEINKRFMKQYPDIVVELTTSPTDKFQQENPIRVKAGDVDLWSDFGFACKLQDFHKGVSLPLVYQNIEAGLVEALDGQQFIKNYKPDAVKDGMTYKRKVYGVCVGSVIISGIYYNKDIFTKYGLNVPTTYSELLKVCDTLKSKGIVPFTAAGAPLWPIDMIAHGFIGALIKDLNAFEKELWTGGTGWKNPKYIEALKRYQKLLQNYYEEGFQTIDYNPHIGRFISGKAAMLPDGIWMSTAIASQGGDKFNFGYMPIPASDNAADNKTFYGKYDLMWQVHSKSKLKKEAFAWLTFFSKKENYQYFINTVGWLPTQPGIEVKDKILMEASKLPMKLSFEQIHVSRDGQGQFADGVIHWIVPMGKIKTVEEFVNLAQKDWEAAATK